MFDMRTGGVLAGRIDADRRFELKGGREMEPFYIAMMVLFSVASVYLLCALAATILNLRDSTRQLRRFSGERDESRLTIATGGAAFLAVAICIGAGVHFLLWFIPDSWGSASGEGNAIPIRQSIGCFAGFWGALALVDVLETHQKQKMQVLELRRDIELLKLRGDVRWNRDDEAYYQREIDRNAMQIQRLERKPFIEEQELCELKARERHADALNRHVYQIRERSEPLG